MIALDDIKGQIVLAQLEDIQITAVQHPIIEHITINTIPVIIMVAFATILWKNKFK